MGRQRQAVEGAEPVAPRALRVVEARRERARRAGLEGAEGGGHGTAGGGTGHREQPGVPAEAVGLGELPGLAGADRLDVGAVVDGGEVVRGDRFGRLQGDPRDGPGLERLGDPAGLAGGVEGVRAQHVGVRVEDRHLTAAGVPARARHGAHFASRIRGPSSQPNISGTQDVRTRPLASLSRTSKVTQPLACVRRW